MSILDELITDRSQTDLDALQSLLNRPKSQWTAEQLEEFNLALSKGSYNYTDLNRVTEAMEYINNQLVGYGYQTGYQRVEVPHKAGGRLPEGYTEVEYIQSSGTQWIDTGFKPNQDTRVVMDADIIDSGYPKALFGGRDGRVNAYILWALTESSFRSDYNVSSEGLAINVTTVGRHAIDKNKNVTIIDENSVTDTAVIFQGSYNMAIFAYAETDGSVDSRKASMRLYSCKIYDNGLLVRDFIPCSNLTGAVGLYDLVGQEFYGNAGTGTFTAGTEVDDTTNEDLDPYTWYESDLPTESLMESYLANVEALRSTLDVLESTPQTPESMEALTWVEANNIEQILLDVQKMINQVVESFSRSNAFTFWSGNRPLPSADSDLGRTWEELDAMNVPWENLETADWFLLAYGNLGVGK